MKGLSGTRALRQRFVWFVFGSFTVALRVFRGSVTKTQALAEGFRRRPNHVLKPRRPDP